MGVAMEKKRRCVFFKDVGCPDNRVRAVDFLLEMFCSENEMSLLLVAVVCFL